MSIIAYSEIGAELCQLLIPEDLALVVTIPCYNEDAIMESVNSLLNCDRPDCHVEIMVLINTPENEDQSIAELNQRSYKLLTEMTHDSSFSVIPIHVNQIPAKNAGVGLARKLVMDEACRRLSLSNHPIKIISCFDADCHCETNYLTSIYNHFSKSKKEAVSIYYEHPTAILNGHPHEHAIYLYELHLRYFIDMQRQINLPFSIHTVGSSMACTANGYQRIGGMNTRKAGEDFYFLQKFIQDNQCDRLTNTAIYPSARESDRVPFGTGKAIGDIISGDHIFLTYNAKSFSELKYLSKSIDELYDTNDIDRLMSAYPIPLVEFLHTISFKETILRLRGNTKTIDTFRKAFYQFFDAFQLMKYLHFVRDKYYPNVNILDAAQKSLILHHKIDLPSSELLDHFRQLDKR